MANVFVELRPKGKPEGSPTTDYIVEDHADHPLATFKTQEQPSNGLKSMLIRRTSRASDALTTKRSPNHWRAV